MNFIAMLLKGALLITVATILLTCPLLATALVVIYLCKYATIALSTVLIPFILIAVALVVLLVMYVSFLRK